MRCICTDAFKRLTAALVCLSLNEACHPSRYIKELRTFIADNELKITTAGKRRTKAVIVADIAKSKRGLSGCWIEIRKTRRKRDQSCAKGALVAALVLHLQLPREGYSVGLIVLRSLVVLKLLFNRRCVR